MPNLIIGYCAAPPRPNRSHAFASCPASVLSVMIALAFGMKYGAVGAAVPLTLAADGHETVPAFVNGAGPFQFILDTGADGSALYEWFAKKQHLHAGEAHDVDGQTGSVSAPTYRIKKLSIDGHTIRNAEADGLPNRHDAGREAGVAGNDLMDRTVAVFDFPCHKVALTAKRADLSALVPRDSLMVEGGTVADGTVLTLPILLNGVEATAFLDTGSRDTRISPGLAAAAHIDPASAAFRDADLIFGFKSKGTPSRIGPIGSLKFAGITLPQVQARVINLAVFGTFRASGPPAMILGMDLMQRYRLVYDHEARHFWFTPSSCAAGTPK
jgi:predicted aspartyl protease